MWPQESLIANDSFGCGCAIAFLCSRGLHPFASALHPSLSDNILANRRMRRKELGIKDQRHSDLVLHLTTREPSIRWTVQQAIQRSQIFEHGAVAEGSHRGGVNFDAQILLDTIEFYQKPQGDCRAQLVAASEVCKHCG